MGVLNPNYEDVKNSLKHYGTPKSDDWKVIFDKIDEIEGGASSGGSGGFPQTRVDITTLPSYTSASNSWQANLSVLDPSILYVYDGGSNLNIELLGAPAEGIANIQFACLSENLIFFTADNSENAPRVGEARETRGGLGFFEFKGIAGAGVTASDDFFFVSGDLAINVF